MACSAWVSVMTAAALCSIELASAGTVRLQIVAPAMLLTHAVIGIGEALITCAVASFALRIRPDLEFAPGGAPARMPLGRTFATGCAAAVGLILLLSPWASSAPDGLESVAQRFQFGSQQHAILSAPAPDYSIPGIESEAGSLILAGTIGTLICLGVALGIARWWQRAPARIRE